MENIFYNDWSTIGVTAAKGVLIYIALIAMLRISGKRSLSKFNIFDFVITIAIGSIFASTLTSNDVKLAQAVTAIVVLLGGQYLISKLALRSESFEKLVKSDPALLFYSGEFNEETMKNERVTRREVLQAVRGSGSSSMDDVAAVILETDGTISVIGAAEGAAAPKRNDLFDSVKRNPEA
ncbi:DUF421 domain-containing protein [Corynebacterium lipophiloflavum]|uniref:DUF421 domain-containing protein n=1 Tax=Corynebacterium lipophiloflavum (strain ATCC 700352 / DSM 44291 / CCUG 37336 / JCM 10383 / DMMZ 1944) TaxID=525263 RepID=C0XSY8_CORLD|nr:YetF domain-containing protein [Corynebacterium lipophiloflavum]EEI16662.1 hypothetical protein HMPREF0298_1558 [Corynebacterium lipophiloflavum DSM 44291]